MTTATRETLISTGVHLGAIRRLGSSYTADEYLAAVDAAQAARDGEAYADACLGVEVDALLRGVESEDDGEAVVRAAEANLSRRGVDPRKATYGQYRDALVEASS
jgi:hypothetical protein